MENIAKYYFEYIGVTRANGGKPRVDIFFSWLLTRLPALGTLFTRVGLDLEVIQHELNAQIMAQQSITETLAPPAITRLRLGIQVLLLESKYPNDLYAFIIACNSFRDYSWITKYTSMLKDRALNELQIKNQNHVIDALELIMNAPCEVLQDRLKFTSGSKILNIPINSRNTSNVEYNNGQGSTAVEANDGNPLELFCTNMCDKVKVPGVTRVYGRETETRDLLEILCRKTKNCPILLGDPGTGKTAIVESLARDIAHGRVSALPKNTQIYELNLTSLIAGCIYRGQLEMRIKGLLSQLKSNRNIILFIDEIHMVMTRKEDPLNIANMLKPALSSGEISCIGATTYEEYAQYIETDKALARRFTPVRVKELTALETICVLRDASDSYGKWHSVEYSEDILQKIVEYSERYITDRRFPDKALDILDISGAKARIEYSGGKVVVPNIALGKMRMQEFLDYSLENKIKDISSGRILDSFVANIDNEAFRAANIPTKTPAVKEEHVIAAITRRTGIPSEVILPSGDGINSVKRVKELLQMRIIGQDAAIETVTKTLIKQRMGLAPDNRPFASFLFAGKTGVGKTLMAKELSKILYPGRDSFIRLDMSEYMEKHAVSRLIGAPPGYVGYENAGQLSEKLRHNPHSLVLIDEMEKAHPDVLSVFLQILEDGRLTDGHGNVVDCTNAMFIFTTNAGAEKLDAKPIGFISENNNAKSRDTWDILERYFRPELLNRMDAIIVFNPFSASDLRNILVLELEKLSERIASKGNRFKLTKGAMDALLRLADTERTGARELRRLVEKKVSEIIINRIWEGENDIVIKQNDIEE